MVVLASAAAPAVDVAGSIVVPALGPQGPIAIPAVGAQGPVAALPYTVLGAPWTLLMLLFWVVVIAAALWGGSAVQRARTAARLGRLPGQVGALPTERRPSHERPRGYKVARLVADPVTGEAAFLGLTLGGLYGRDDAAACEVLAGRLPPPRRWGRRTPPPPHQAPDLACTCGFHAFNDRDEATEFLASRPPVGRMFGPVLLEVDLAGTVIEFDRGYRAGAQRVLGVRVPRWCLTCARSGEATPAQRVAGPHGTELEEACRLNLPQHPSLYRVAMAVHHAEVLRRLDGWAALQPVCDAHTPRTLAGHTVLEIAELAGALGTEVSWLDDGSFSVETFVEAISWRPVTSTPRRP